MRRSEGKAGKEGQLPDPTHDRRLEKVLPWASPEPSPLPAPGSSVESQPLPLHCLVLTPLPPKPYSSARASL